MSKMEFKAFTGPIHRLYYILLCIILRNIVKSVVKVFVLVVTTLYMLQPLCIHFNNMLYEVKSIVFNTEVYLL